MIMIVIGGQGSGKTLFLAMQARKAFLQGRKIYSNFKLNFPHDNLDFDEMMQCKLYNSSVFLDEAHLWGLDSRSSLKKVNKMLVKQFVVQCRKQDVNLYCATQRLRQLDIRVRENAEYYADCKKFLVNGNEIEHAIQSKQYPESQNILIDVELFHLDTEKTRKMAFRANPIYKYYTTTEVIHMIDEDKYDNDKKKSTKAKDSKNYGVA